MTITTDLRCSTEEPGTYRLDRTDVQVLVDGEARQIGMTDGCAKGRVGNIVFVPGGSGEVRLHVVGTVFGEPDPITADRILRFLPHQSLRLDVELSSACVGVKCNTGYTCIKGSCVEIPHTGSDDAGTPIDAGPDATVSKDSGSESGTDGGNPVDGSLMDVVTLDGPLMDGNLDAGKCAPSPFLQTDVHWGFNEGVNATTIRDDSMVYMANLIANVGLANNPPCKTGLNFNGSTAQNLSTTNWAPTPTLGIAFDFQLISGTGTILERNPGKAGGWRFSVGGGKLAFDLWNNNDQSVPVTVTLGLGPTTVIGTFVQGTHKLSAYNTSAQLAVSLSLQGYNSDINVGASGIKFGLDELWLGR